MAKKDKPNPESINLDNLEIPPEVIDKVPSQMAKAYHIIPIEYNKEKNELSVALGSTDNLKGVYDLETLMGFRVTPKLTNPKSIEKALIKYYKEDKAELDELRRDIDETAKELAEAGFELQREALRGSSDSMDLEELKELSESNPVKKLTNLVLLQAIRDKASDIYFETFEGEFKMRYRINGILYEMIPPPKYIAEAMGSRLEQMAGKLEEEKLTEGQKRKLRKKGKEPKITKLLNTGETAQIELTVQGKGYTPTLSKISTKFGDSYRVKIFYPEFCKSVFNETQKEKIAGNLLKDRGGLIFIVGMPRNGKTTTAHALLDMRNRPDKILLAIGGERTVDGIHHINTDLKYTNLEDLSKQIDSFNPDILYLDDISKTDVAEIAIEQARKGKTVIGSLNAKDTLAGLEYLVKKGMEKSELADVFRGAIEQKFERQKHEECYGDGCDKCINGYLERKLEMKFIWDEDESGKAIREYLKTEKYPI